MHPPLRLTSLRTACAVVALAGCASSSRQVSTSGGSVAPAATSAAASAGASESLLRAMAGTWDGRSRPAAGDDTTSSAFRLESTAARTGWVLTFSNDTTRQRVPGRAVVVEGDSVVTMWGPYNADFGGGRIQRVLTQSVARLDGGKMVGTYDLRPASAPDSIIARGRFEATRVP
jgi:hypothetical protein